MKVAELERGQMYRVSRSCSTHVRACFKDDLGPLVSSINMLSIMQRPTSNSWRRKARSYPANPPMVYLGVKHLHNKVWGMKKYHWFLVEGKEVGMVGHDARTLQLV